MQEWFSRSVLTKGKRPKTSEAQGIMGKERKAKRKGEAPVANLYHPTVLRARRRERRLGVWVKKSLKKLSILPNQTVRSQQNYQEKTERLCSIKTKNPIRSDPFAFRPKFSILVTKVGLTTIIFNERHVCVRYDRLAKEDYLQRWTNLAGNFYAERNVPFISRLNFQKFRKLWHNRKHPKFSMIIL